MQILSNESFKTSYIHLYNKVFGVMRFKNKNILHFPRLDTVLMVEDFIQKSPVYLSKTQLWKKLPKKVMYQTFCTIIDYLIDSRKIILAKNNKIIWVFADSEKARKLIEKSVKAYA